MNDSLIITDVTARDGLQSQPQFIETTHKKKLIDLLLKAGHAKLEVVSFVSPQKVPQFKDAETLLSFFPNKDNFITLVPNLKGLERAIASKIKNISLLSSISDSFARKNLGKPLEQHLSEMKEVLALGSEKGIHMQASFSMAFYCPDEKEISLKKLEKQIQFFQDQGCNEFVFCDTCSKVTPELLVRSLSVTKQLQNIGLHLHSQEGNELNTVRKALELGVRKFETGLRESGGCPFLEGSKNNYSTESIVLLAREMGIQSSIDLSLLGQAQLFFKSII